MLRGYKWQTPWKGLKYGSAIKAKNAFLSYLLPPKTVIRYFWLTILTAYILIRVLLRKRETTVFVISFQSPPYSSFAVPIKLGYLLNTFMWR